MTGNPNQQSNIQSQIAQIRQELALLDRQYGKGLVEELDYRGQRETLLQELSDLSDQLKEGHQ